MANITHEDFQKARRISRAIQEYLEFTGNDGARTTDLYDYLSNKGVIEKDRHQGVKFRQFLKRLKDNDMLKLIPQCTYSYSKYDVHEWRFYKIDSNKTPESTPQKENISHREHFPVISGAEIDELIAKAKPHIDSLPKKTDEFTAQHLETRNNYKRAYEYWTPREDEIATRAFLKFQRIDKVAQLLERQPSAVERRLTEIGVIK